MENEKKEGEIDKKDEVYTGNKMIDIDILVTMRKAIFKIIVNKKESISYGTGFFMRVSDSKRYLITNYHVIDSNSLNEKIEIEIWNKKKYILNNFKFNTKYLTKPKDITAIEMIDWKDISEEVQFLNYDKNYEDGYIIYKDADVFTIEHPLGKNASCSFGNIININKYEFDHNISTEPGSSGCPILLLMDNINLIKVIGIHKNGDKKNKINGGTFIGEIINEIKNDPNIKFNQKSDLIINNKKYILKEKKMTFIERIKRLVMGNNELSSIYAKMPGYPFISECPACENYETIPWCHESDQGLETIDDEGNIHCQKCTINKFLKESKYDCGKHNGKSLEPNWKRLLYVISQLATTEKIPDDICEKICHKILLHKNK